MNSWQRNIETFAKTPEILRRIAEPAYREALGLGTELREEYHFLARGEYNENFVFTHPDCGKKYVLRINHGSQMQLERQISYEAHALKLLENSGRTPKLYYCSERLGEPGILVMEFLEGFLTIGKRIQGKISCIMPRILCWKCFPNLQDCKGFMS